MRPTALVLSPHLDDAAFSCGGTIARLSGGGWRVVLATAFTRSMPNPTGFALACQLDKGLGPAVDYMAVRRAEDRRAAEALGVGPPVWLDLPEAPHRGYGSAAELFAETRREDDAVVATLTAAIQELATAVAPELVLAPQAIGGHVDHVQLVRALRRAAVAAPVLWWRDFPYAVRDDTPKQPFARDMGVLSAVEVAIGAAASTAKRAACLAYASQIGFQFGGSAGLEARLNASGGVECFKVMGRSPAELEMTDALV